MAQTYDMNERARTDGDTIGAGISEAGSEMAHAARGTGNGGRAGIAEMRLGAQHVGEAVKETLHGAQHVVAERASDTKHAIEGALDRGCQSAKHAIAKHPMVSVGIAAGVGVLIGLILLRPRG